MIQFANSAEKTCKCCFTVINRWDRFCLMPLIKTRQYVPSAGTKCEELAMPWRGRLNRLKKWPDKRLSKVNAKSCARNSISHAAIHAGQQLDRKQHWTKGHGGSQQITRCTCICNLSLWQRNTTIFAKFNCQQGKGNKLCLFSAPVTSLKYCVQLQQSGTKTGHILRGRKLETPCPNRDG